MRRTFIRRVLPLLLGLLACRAEAGTDSLFHLSRPAMGSRFDLYVYAPDEARARVWFEVAAAEVERIEQLLSNYRPTSELSRINRYAGGEAVTTDPEVFAFLRRSFAYSRLTDGAFDLTVGPLVEAWGFFKATGRYPSPEALRAARERTGWWQVVLDTTARTVRFRTPGVVLDPGAGGKGYALDRVAEVLRAHGVTSALVGLGTSSYYAIGAPPGEGGWAVRVPDPTDRSRTLSIIRLRDEALSTSGSYEKFFEMDGRTYSHLLDPRTGAPVEGRLQVTVVAPEAEESDVLSTAVFVLGPERAAVLLSSYPQVAALIVDGEAAHPRVVSLGWHADIRVDASSKR